MSRVSRRDFVALAAAGSVATPFALKSGLTRASAAVTAQEIVDRVKKNIGVDWSSDDVDTFKAGDPSTVVTGVVTTSMATLDVLQKAVQAGANLVITAAPTFYSKADLSTPAGRGFGAGSGTNAPAAAAAAAPPPPDPVYAGKNDFIAKHKLVVFRLTQHWNRRRPDPRAQGLAAAVGWTKYKVGDDGLHYEVPVITFDALASHLKKSLGTRGGIRAIGDRTMTVRRIGLLPGYTMIPASIAMLPDVDVIVAGEVQEWESATYVQDVAFAGLKKGFISIGRVVNEAPGMQVCADWLKTIVPEILIRFISAGDPYWRPL
jgi:putative NIF3 family GTP cyclohydrolase 1 type 2